METTEIVKLLENNDALGFTKFLKEALAAETAAQLAEGTLTPIMPCTADCTMVHNHHKAVETAAGKAATVTQTTATNPGKDAGSPETIKVMESKIEEHKAAAVKALTESNMDEAMKQLSAAKTLEEEMAVANKHNAEQTALAKAATVPGKSTATDSTKKATPAMKDGVLVK